MHWELLLKKEMIASVCDATGFDPMIIGLLQGRESVHFLSLFPDGMVTLMPSSPPAHSSTAPSPLASSSTKPQRGSSARLTAGKAGSRAKRKPAPPQLFRITALVFSGSNDHGAVNAKKGSPEQRDGQTSSRLCCRAVEVPCSVKELVSTDCFVLRAGGNAVYVWNGRFSSKEKKTAAARFASRVNFITT